MEKTVGAEGNIYTTKNHGCLYYDRKKKIKNIEQFKNPIQPEKETENRKGIHKTISSKKKAKNTPNSKNQRKMVKFNKTHKRYGIQLDV